jgi:putative Holliday junction resolvase
MIRILGLDVGSKTIGVALSDPLGFTAQGIDTIRRTSIKKDIDLIVDYYKKYSATAIVIGMPKNMDGTIGFQGESVIKFSETLKKELDAEIIFWDERLTTVAAHNAMLEANMSREKRKKIVDKVAATYILQGYLDKISK